MQQCGSAGIPATVTHITTAQSPDCCTVYTVVYMAVHHQAGNLLRRCCPLLPGKVAVSVPQSDQGTSSGSAGVSVDKQIRMTLANAK